MHFPRFVLFRRKKCDVGFHLSRFPIDALRIVVEASERRSFFLIESALSWNPKLPNKLILTETNETDLSSDLQQIQKESPQTNDGNPSRESVDQQLTLNSSPWPPPSSCCCLEVSWANTYDQTWQIHQMLCTCLKDRYCSECKTFWPTETQSTEVRHQRSQGTLHKLLARHVTRRLKHAQCVC